MSELKTIVPNVMEFLGRSCELVGRFEAERWSQRNFCDLLEGPIDSPIEQMFYIAVRTLALASYQDFNPDADLVDGNWVGRPGIYLVPQMRIGDFRVDFVLFLIGCGPPDENHIAIELDGHAFHDKDKKQRAYEKARDRFLVKSGYKVLHFTGSEVVKDPFAVAHEAMSLLGPAMFPEYDPDDPMGCGL